MNLGLDLNINIGLEQRLSPQMIQSLKLLQMNAMELELTVKQELETNPLLETGDEISDSEEEGDEGSREESNDADEKSDSSDEKTSEESSEYSEGPPALEPIEIASTDPAEKKDEIDWEAYLEDGFD
jgi:RNA polymerase sigma-54 factor